MEAVEQRSPAAAVPLALILSVLIALLIALAVWSAVSRPAPSVPQRPSAVPASTSLSPDAQQRNAELLAARLGKAEATHGH